MIVARAPGKLVALGEYAVLDGAPAIVLAVDRYVEAAVDLSPEAVCALATHAAEPAEVRFPPGSPSGFELVDLVTRSVSPPLVWSGSIDSSAFFAGAAKLGLGSSAAVLCAFAGAFSAFARAQGRPVQKPSLPALIGLHRAFQGGRGSGLDVAAAFTGGAISFRLAAGGVPEVGSVPLPNSVGFAGVFPGRSASTPERVSRYLSWRRERPVQAATLVGRLQALAERGCAAALGNDAAAWLAVFAAYGRGLQDLGDAIGAEVVTAEHRRIGAEAERFGVAYKVSGAGGGDLGLACAADGDALAAFIQSVTDLGFRVMNVSLAGHGLIVEQRAVGALP